MLHKKITKIIGGLALILATAGVLTGCGDGKNRLPGNKAADAANRLMVSAILVQPRLLENKIYTTATLLANEEVELRPETSGRITGVFFNEGGQVKKGQLLLKIDDSELQAQLKRKELEEKLASDEESRKRSLFEIQGISQEEYDRAVNALKMVQAEKEVIESQLAKTEIVAPFDGIIGLRHISEGSYVSANVLAATMQDIDPMKVEFSIPEKYARQIGNGSLIKVTVGNSQKEYSGRVYAVESKIDLGTRTIKARATIPNSNGELIPGSFAKVEVTLEQIPNAIVIPAEAVIPELNGEKVFLYESGKVRSVPVKTGMRSEGDVQIIEGLQPQDTLIVTGLLQLADGRPVELKELNNESAVPVH